jgi:hypothetical protein
MNIFDPLVSGSLSVSGSAQISGSLTVLGNISGITSNALTSSYVEYNNVANKPSLISGSGTLNYIPKFTGANSLGNSLIFDNGTNVLIGTTSTPTPVVGVAFPLTVTSPNTTRIRIDSTQATPNSGFGLYANGVQKWSIAMFGATSDFTIYNDALLASAILVKGTNSNVLIGTTTDAGFRLDVNGTARIVGATRIDNLAGTGTRMVVADANGVVGTQQLPNTDPLEFNITDRTVWNNGSGDVETNTSFGKGALKSNPADPFFSANNTAFGFNALQNNISEFNTAVGTYALVANIGGYLNTALGVFSLENNITGHSNTANGVNALRNNTTGNNNTGNGRSSLEGNTEGNFNTANGVSSLQTNTTGSGNTADGFEALRSNTTGNYNTAQGYEAGQSIANGSPLTITNNSVFLGANTKALADNQTNQIVIGHNAIGLGSNTAVLGNDAITFTGLKGNVGINTTTDANFKLDVNGTGRFNTSLTVGAGGLTGRLSVRGTTNDSSAFAFEAANSSGNSLFVVRNDGAATFSSSVTAASATFNSTGGVSVTSNDTFSANLNVVFNDANVGGTRNQLNFLADQSAGYIRTLQNYPISIVTNGTERLRITSTGNIGIGTISPSYLLTVGQVGTTADSYIQIASTSTGTGNLFFGDATGGGSASFSGYIQYQHGVDSMVFGTSSTGRLRITSGGNVLIGTTTNNGERLQVNGSISASDQLKRYVESMNSGQTISFSLNDSGFGMRLFMISAFNNANANANIMALCMVNTRNLNFGGGNSILTIGTTQNSTGTSGEISSLGYSIGGSGTALTLNVTASLASGSGTIQIRVQEIKWVG